MKPILRARLVCLVVLTTVAVQHVALAFTDFTWTSNDASDKANWFNTNNWSPKHPTIAYG